MPGSGVLMFTFCAVIAWVFVLVACSDGSYNGWFKHQSTFNVLNISSNISTTINHGTLMGWQVGYTCLF